MKPGQITQAAVDGNPWWSDSGWAARDVSLRNARASGLTYEPNILTDVNPGGLVLLRGPRRVGKSVELKRHVAHLLGVSVPPRSIIHAAVDGWSAEDLRALVTVAKRLVPAGAGHRYWLIDEISGVPGWAATVKNLRDNDPEFSEDTVILTGSSAADLSSASSHLAGRRGKVTRPDRTLLPMGFRTFADIMMRSRDQPLPEVPALAVSELRDPMSGDAFTSLVPWLTELVAWWEIYLQCGGFPQAVSAQLSGESLGPLTQALFDIVQRDALGGTRLGEAETLALLGRVAQGLCSPVNLTTIAEDVGGSRETIVRHLAGLSATYLTWPCHQSDRLRPRLKTQSKHYFVDPLLARLAHARHPAHPAPDATQLTEQQLGVALARRLEADSPGSYAGYDSVLYERTPTRKEIDFVGSGMEPVAIESKYTDSEKWKSETVTLNASAHAGILATRGVLDTTATSPDQSWAVPASFIAYCIDL